MNRNKKGMALATTLVLTALALILLLSVLYMVWKSTSTSGSVKQYSTALEAAKAAATYIVDKLDNPSSAQLTCNSGGACNDNGSIDMGYAAYMSNYNISANLLKKYDMDALRYKYYFIRVNSINKNNPKEQAIIEFVFEEKTE